MLDPFLSTCGEEFADARQDFITFCTAKDNATSDLCATAIKHLCTDDPFNPACGVDFQDRRDLLIETCTIGAGTNPNCPQFVSTLSLYYKSISAGLPGYLRLRPHTQSRFLCLGRGTTQTLIAPILPPIFAPETRLPRFAIITLIPPAATAPFSAKPDGNAAADICASAIIRDPLRGRAFRPPLRGINTPMPAITARSFAPLAVTLAMPFARGVIVRDACVLDPFASGCNNTPARTSRMAFCGVKDNATHTLCADTVLTPPRPLPVFCKGLIKPHQP